MIGLVIAIGLGALLGFFLATSKSSCITDPEENSIQNSPSKLRLPSDVVDLSDEARTRAHSARESDRVSMQFGAPSVCDCSDSIGDTDVSIRTRTPRRRRLEALD